MLSFLSSRATTCRAWAAREYILFNQQGRECCSIRRRCTVPSHCNESTRPAGLASLQNAIHQVTGRYVFYYGTCFRVNKITVVFTPTNNAPLWRLRSRPIESSRPSFLFRTAAVADREKITCSTVSRYFYVSNASQGPTPFFAACRTHTHLRSEERQDEEILICAANCSNYCARAIQ